MINLFISQPMKGKTDKEIREIREEAIKEVTEMFPDEDVEIIDSFIKEDPPSDVNNALWYLGQSLLLLSKANVAYFAKGWRNARGCIIENQCANEYHLITIQTN